MRNPRGKEPSHVHLGPDYSGRKALALVPVHLFHGIQGRTHLSGECVQRLDRGELPFPIPLPDPKIVLQDRREHHRQQGAADANQ
jgi:hypothetical protein